MKIRHILATAALTLSLGLLAACDSAEERAEKRYQSGLEYLAQGDIDRALVEFRNVFQLNNRHKEARKSYAEAELGRGRLREAFAQYLRLLEQYPDDQETKVALARLAAEGGDWVTAATYSGQALVSAPDDLDMQAINLTGRYMAAAADSDVSELVDTAKAARELRDKLPDNLLLRRVIIDDEIRAQRYDAALEELEAAIAIAPDDRAFYAQRLSIHAANGDNAAVETGLIDMVDRFPDSPEMAETLVRWYISQEEFDKAEAYLRGAVQEGSPNQEQVLDLIRFLAEYRGPEQAVAELDRVIEAGHDTPVYRAARAGFTFDLGRRQEAIADMQAILETAQPAEDEWRTKVGLARMMATDGNIVGARALVEEVLAEDAGNAEGLKLKAGWLILGDEVGEAIAILRRALDNTPNDPEILTLMAQAYERDGNRDLMRESLSRAVVASNRAPEESLRYAQMLASENKFLPAEGVLIDALRIAPGNLSLLVPLGQIYVAVQDWPRATTVAAELESLDDPEARATAHQLRTAILSSQNNTDEAIGYLEGLVEGGEGGLAAKVAILQAHLANDQNAQALAYSDDLLASDPDNPDLRFIDASVRTLLGRTDEAEATFRDLVGQDATRLPVWMSLLRIVLSDPARTDDAAALLDRAEAALPDSGEVKWAKASFLERTGDIDGAIAIYETLYEENSANPIIANNLASLLAYHRAEDPDSLARAEVIARRLRGSDFAPYQDTYGWIAYLRGDHGAAVKELERAADVLDDDPVVQYHLAAAYLANGRKADALAQFDKAVSIAGEADTRPDIVAAREAAEKLRAEGVTVGN